MMNATELIARARQLLHAPEHATRFVWALAATHLARQALESAIHHLWHLRRVPGLSDANMRNQLVALPFYVSDRALAGRVAWVWSALSEAGHDRGLEHAPTAADLGAWLTVVEGFIVMTG